MTRARWTGSIAVVAAALACRPPPPPEPRFGQTSAGPRDGGCAVYRLVRDDSALALIDTSRWEPAWRDGDGVPSVRTSLGMDYHRWQVLSRVEAGDAMYYAAQGEDALVLAEVRAGAVRRVVVREGRYADAVLMADGEALVLAFTAASSAWFARWDPGTGEWSVPPRLLVDGLPSCKAMPGIRGFVRDGPLFWVVIFAHAIGEHGPCFEGKAKVERSELIAVTRDGAVGQPLEFPVVTLARVEVVDGVLLGRQHQAGRAVDVGFRVECADPGMPARPST